MQNRYIAKQYSVEHLTMVTLMVKSSCSKHISETSNLCTNQCANKAIFTKPTVRAAALGKS